MTGQYTVTGTGLSMVAVTGKDAFNMFFLAMLCDAIYMLCALLTDSFTHWTLAPTLLM